MATYLLKIVAPIAILLLADASVPQMVQVSADVYLIFNTSMMVVIAFWVGVQWNRISGHGTEIKDLKIKIDSHIVPITRMQEQLDNIEEDLKGLTTSFSEFHKSVFMDAMRISQRKGE